MIKKVMGFLALRELIRKGIIFSDDSEGAAKTGAFAADMVNGMYQGLQKQPRK